MMVLTMVMITMMEERRGEARTLFCVLYFFIWSLPCNIWCNLNSIPNHFGQYHISLLCCSSKLTMMMTRRLRWRVSPKQTCFLPKLMSRGKKTGEGADRAAHWHEISSSSDDCYKYFVSLNPMFWVVIGVVIDSFGRKNLRTTLNCNI